MGKTRTTTENTKKAAGNAKKAEAALQKESAASAKKAAAEDAEWAKGAKSNSKKDEADAKKQEAARKKAEKDALLAAEEPTARATPKKAKTATKKPTPRGLDLGQLDADGDAGPSAGPAPAPATLNASGIDNALDALALAGPAGAGDARVDRHPERRVKAAYAAFEARRLPELEAEHAGLRRQQRIELVRKEFARSAENPFNQVVASYDASQDEVRGLKAAEREKIEARLGEA